MTTITNARQLPDKSLRCFKTEAAMLETCRVRGWTIKHAWHLSNATNELWYAEVE